MNVNFPTSGPGEFRGDFTRDSFDATKAFTRVLLQQGRVQMDADWNEQTSIVLHYLRMLVTDLIGPAAGPEHAPLSVKLEGGSIQLNAGRYYVDGLLVENTATTVVTKFGTPPFWESFEMGEAGAFFIFLDVWERHVTSDTDADIADVALGGIDTASRAKVAWRLCALRGLDKTELVDAITNHKMAKIRKEAESVKTKLFGYQMGKLNARAGSASSTTDLCRLSPEAKFRGLENQLYRVEIHRTGLAVGSGDEKTAAATFKWSSDNSSIVLPVVTYENGRATLAHLGRDASRGVKVKQWVELVLKENETDAQPGPLLRVRSIIPDETAVVLETAGHSPVAGDQVIALRRWDHTSEEMAIPVTQAQSNSDGWITLEDGIQIQFPQIANAQYHAGDYWLIPARVATGNVLWGSEAQLPHGPDHHYALLAAVLLGAGGTVEKLVKLHAEFAGLGK
jgi:hypothetical protein